MKNLYTSLLFALCLPFSANVRSRLYSTPVVAIDQYLRDSAHVIGRLDLEFPDAGTVYIQFDGEDFGSPDNHILLAANIDPDWDTKYGNGNFPSAVPNKVHCF